MALSYWHILLLCNPTQTDSVWEGEVGTKLVFKESSYIVVIRYPGEMWLSVGLV
jgi:hypothetical protein